jgi:hypothetical protein
MNELKLSGPVFYRRFDERFSIVAGVPPALERIATCEPVFHRLLDERIATCDPEFYRHFDERIATSQDRLENESRLASRSSTGTSMNELRLFGPVFYRRFGERIETCGMFEGALMQTKVVQTRKKGRQQLRFEDDFPQDSSLR